MTKFGGKALLKKIKNHTIDIIQTFINPGEVRFTDVWPKIDQIEGFLMTGQEEWLFKTVKSLPNEARILEIGCFKGRSTVCMAYGCVGTRRHVFTIDTFKGVYQDVEDREDLKQIFSEGFFDENREIADTTWITKMNPNALGQLVEFNQQVADGTWELWEGTNDCIVSIIYIESILANNPELEFTTDDAINWSNKYAFSATLEFLRRSGKAFAKSLDVPLDDILWTDDPAKFEKENHHLES